MIGSLWTYLFWLQILFAASLVAPEYGEGTVPVWLAAVGYCFVLALPIIAEAVLLQGSLVLRMLGLSVHDAQDRQASRRRILARMCVCWLPLLLGAGVAFARTPSWTAFVDPIALVAGGIGLAFFGASALFVPEEAWQDRLLRTRLVLD